MERMEADIAVIGSGVGGMCSAALLAHAGYSTVVLEGLSFLGGRFSCIETHGFKIATGGHMVNHGKDDPIYRTLLETGAPEIEFREFKVPVRYRIAGKDHDLKGKGGLKEIVSAAALDDEETSRVMAALYSAMRDEEPSPGLSLRDWLLEHTDNEGIQNIFQCQATAFTGVNACDFPAGEFVRFLRSYARLRGTLVPKGTGKSVIHALKKVIEERSGRVFTGLRATKILVERGEAKGVAAEGNEGGLRIEAKVVVSNVGPKKTIELAGEENFGEAYLRSVSEQVRPSAAMDYIIVSDRPLLDGLLFTPEAQRTEAWSPTSLFWPEEAPEGKHVIEGYAAPVSGEGYVPEKEYQVFLQDLEQTFPMFEEYGGRIVLARQFRGDWPVNRCYQGYDPPQETPVTSLYNVGDGVKPSGWVGASGAALSGRMVAEKVKEGG